MTSLVEKVVAIHDALAEASLAHAFGGALALAWCTRAPRGTSDIDVNVFVPSGQTSEVLAALPGEVRAKPAEVRQLERDGQARLHWDSTPVDVFLDTTTFHQSAAERVSFEPLGGRMVPFLGCSDLAVFKVFFDRRRDWADLEDMMRAGTVDVDGVAGVVSEFRGADDRVARLRDLWREVRDSSD